MKLTAFIISSIFISICANAQITISGKIKTELGNAIPGVTVTLSGDNSLVAITGNDGLYNFNVIIGGNYTITPSKNYDSPNNKGITTLDLLLMRQHALSGQSLVSSYKIIAADGNASSTVTTIDILLSRALILGILQSFPNGRLWEFVSSDFIFNDPLNPFPYETSRAYTNVQQSITNHDFIGIKLGDVNNSWDEGRCDSITGVTDIDGNSYDVVKISNQCWMKENLKVTRYRDGSSIPYIIGNNQWDRLRTAAYCHYNDSIVYDTIYGKLYNWYAVSDTHRICPQGWHVPTYSEWLTLINYLGGDSLAGGKLKSITGWNFPNTGADNSSNFSALPGGHRDDLSGECRNKGGQGHFWSSSIYNSSTAWKINVRYNGNYVTISYLENASGFSCRCIHDY